MGVVPTSPLAREGFLRAHPEAMSPSEVIRLLRGSSASVRAASMPETAPEEKLSLSARSKIESELRTGRRTLPMGISLLSSEERGIAEHYRFSRICRAWLTPEGRAAQQVLEAQAEAAAERDRMRIIREGSRIERRTETVVAPGWGFGKTAIVFTAALCLMAIL